MLRSNLIAGPPLLGFLELFEEANGKPPPAGQSPPKVTPSKVGDALLPFPCPTCGKVQRETIDRRRWDHYADTSRGFSWCPWCGARYRLNFDGMPLPEALPPGATHAPAKVEYADGSGKTMTIGPVKVGGLDLLGAFC